jgi:hypothetical protein
MCLVKHRGAYLSQHSPVWLYMRAACVQYTALGKLTVLEKSGLHYRPRLTVL